MKNWSDLTLDERRALLEAVREASGDLLPLLWQAYDGAPDARWQKRMGAALERLRSCDLDLNEVPATLYYLPLHVELLERFAAVDVSRGDKARRERARSLLQLFALGDGMALCDGENLLEVEAVKERAAASVADAKADAAAARGDLGNERTLRAEAQARARNAEALAEAREQARVKAESELAALKAERARNRRNGKRSRPKPGPGEMTDADWSRFLASLDKLFAEVAARPVKLGRLTAIGKIAIPRHNASGARKITVSPAAVLKRWQRWRTKRKKAR